MSMLVRRGTMCHRNSSRRLQRKNQQQRAAMQLQGRPGSAKARSPGVSQPQTPAGGPSSSKGVTPSTSRDGVRGSEGGGTLSGRPWSEPTSRRSSQGFNSVSVDDRRQLFSAGKLNVETGMSAYGSIVYQMKDANMEANSTCEFVYKALKIFSKTVLMTVLLIITIAVPVLMVIIGVQYLHECPLEPNIPIYLLVGGCFGTMKMLWLVCQQIRSRRYERIDDAFAEDSLDEIFTSTSYRATDVALTIFLIVWFGMGNYWVYRIYPPNFLFTLFAPNDWCSKTLYLFAVAQLLFVYAVLGCLVVLIFFLACGQKCVMLFGESYK
ncbi:transmembrane protein 272-like isoform X2 [Portunus trituberculatus]|uniref:transmembrane protein 272-like isoform X2 n=1 Tax=Portunus trituberculatus TaxID=210409 RepID=UPI001E1D0C1C|nr:transmembrane protein 272-like isoform X2 [Portunus trituberculatus]